MELGKDITTDELLEQLSFFEGWEDKYSYIIELGRLLSPLPDSAYCEENIVKGCQSQVWITHSQVGDRYIFQADSDALIVKGLLVVVLIAYNNKTAEEILAFNIDDYFTSLDLLNHISQVRGNGLQAMIARIRDYAR